MATDYQRGYTKGYNTGARKLVEARERHLRELDDAIARAERAERAQGLGQCMDCRLWTRKESCKWGECSANGNGVSTKNANIWIEAPNQPLYTSEAFGCVLWRPLERPSSTGDK